VAAGRNLAAIRFFSMAQERPACPAHWEDAPLARRTFAALGCAVVLSGCTMISMVPVASAAAECGRASWYRMGTMTASGEAMDAGALAGAHRTLPFGTRVRVENLDNGRSVIVRINDRGPFIAGRVIDVTEGAAEQLGMIRAGVADVRVTLVDGNAELRSNCS
jgi:rare lipoprotein A